LNTLLAALDKDEFFDAISRFIDSYEYGNQLETFFNKVRLGYK
jgi:hypothetical protein